MTATARTTDLPASHEAALVATEDEAIIKDIVERLLLAAGPNGLTDHELTIKYFADLSNPGCSPETPRKRRSQLTSERQVIVTTMRRKYGRERVASHVWVHRKHLTPKGTAA